MPAPSRLCETVSLRHPERLPIAQGLAEERPVALICHGAIRAVLMATPADLEDLAIGFALSEGIIQSLSDVETVEIVEQDQGSELHLRLSDTRARILAETLQPVTCPSGHGFCGHASMSAAMRVDPGPVFDPDELARATGKLRLRQPLHEATHVAGFLIPGKGMVALREDVGRLNALDKLIGALARQGIDAAAGAFVLTSRISVDLVRKCALAGCPALISVSPPTAQARDMAEAAGITIATVARGGGFDLHAAPERIRKSAKHVS